MKDYFEFKEINCPVCESGESKIIGYRGGEAHQNGEGVKTGIVRCLNCSHLYPNPMPFPKVDLEEIYVNPDDYFQNHEIAKKKQTSAEIIKNFEKKLGRKGTFLDVGCGRGELMWAAKEAGWEFTGVDPSREFIEYGKKHLGVEGQVGTLEKAQFPANSFDAVAMGGIIEHLYNPSEVLKEVYRVLRPNGWLWFDAPNEDGLYMRFGNLYMRFQGRDWVVVMAPTFSPYHVQGFNPKSLRKILEKNDFSLREIEMCGEVWQQTGKLSLKKKIENTMAHYINLIDKTLGGGLYMSVWCQKKNVVT
jgi:ubiquinone/menaquinone biosynthesis C-methylase UbiE